MRRVLEAVEVHISKCGHDPFGNPAPRLLVRVEDLEGASALRS